MYPFLFVAGTFDHLHDGHKHLLTQAFLHGENVIIGLTSDTFVEKYKKQYNNKTIEQFSVRKEQLLQWIHARKSGRQYEIIPIDDPHEPAASGAYDALIVTPQNRTTGEEINKMRREKHIPTLVLIEVALVLADDQEPISSTRIRALLLPDFLREELKKPLGNIVGNTFQPSSHDHLVVTVGDVTTERFLSLGRTPDLAIIDLHAQRKPYKSFDAFGFPKTIKKHEISSGPGFISHAAIAFITTWTKTKEPSVLVIQGEDDLLVLPLVACVPLGTRIYYGQPQEGMVEVVVTDAVRSQAQLYLSQFTNSF